MAATAVDQEHRVTPRELFFDLVFVLAFTQVATLSPTKGATSLAWVRHRLEEGPGRGKRPGVRLATRPEGRPRPMAFSYRLKRPV
jgi:hypothetical protein